MKCWIDDRKRHRTEKIASKCIDSHEKLCDWKTAALQCDWKKTAPKQLKNQWIFRHHSQKKMEFIYISHTFFHHLSSVENFLFCADHLTVIKNLNYSCILNGCFFIFVVPTASFFFLLLGTLKTNDDDFVGLCNCKVHINIEERIQIVS